MIFKYIFKNSINNFSIAEILCYFIENILKNKEKLQNNEIEEKCENILELYKYISDYDLFFETYKIGLSKRLLSNKSDLEIERYLISKFKLLSGLTATFKIESMIKDYIISEKNELITKKESIENLNMEMNVLILNKGNWTEMNEIKFNIDNSIQKCINYFDKKYCEVNKNKKLEWVLMQSKVVLIFNSNNKKYELTSNTLQGSILLLFNNRIEYTVKKLVDILNCDFDEIVKALFGLSRGKFKFLLKDINDNNFDFSTKLEINRKFSSQYSKAPFKISIPSSPPNTIDIKTKNKIDKDISNSRKYSIDCTLVRIMKSRGQIYHNELITECSKQLSNIFIPDLKLIKKEIEHLIDSEYIERVEDEINLYRYLA